LRGPGVPVIGLEAGRLHGPHWRRCHPPSTSPRRLERAELFEVSRALGHADLATTANTYAHFTDSMASTSERMAGILGPRRRLGWYGGWYGGQTMVPPGSARRDHFVL